MASAKVAPEPPPSDDRPLLEELEDEEDEKERKKKKLSKMDKFDMMLEKVCYFSIMDIIEDNCRVRATNVLVFLLCYVFLVLGMLHIAPSVKPVISKISFAMAPPVSMVSFAERAFEENPKRVAKVNVANDNGSPREGVDVRTYVSSMMPMNPLIPCGTVERAWMNKTLQYLRFAEVCNFQTTGLGKTDKLGIGRVNDLGINGPAGSYTLGVEAEGKRGEGSYWVQVRTRVSTMKVLHPSTGARLYAPETVTIGQNFAIQPSILLLDPQGQPIKGEEVVAFSNQDPMWPPGGQASKSPHYNRQGQKLSELGCSRSMPSDKDGIAKFTCLKVLGSTSENLNIIFTVSSMTFLPWNDRLYTNNNVLPIPIRIYRYSTLVVSNVTDLEVVTGPPSEVVEGDAFPNPVQVRVKGPFGNIAGVTCYALIVKERSLGNVMRFRRQLMGVTAKQLINAKSAPSDESGIATFSNLSFSVYGNTRGTGEAMRVDDASDHGLMFVCNGVESGVHTVQNVITRVRTLRLKRFINREAYVSTLVPPLAQDGSDVFVAILRVVDFEGIGVAGKNVLVRPKDTDGPHQVGLFEVADMKEATKASGFVVVAFQVVVGSGTLNSTLQQKFQVVFSVDGLEQVSDELTLKAREQIDPAECHIGLFAQVYLPIGGDYSNMKKIEIFDERPTVISGQALVFVLMFTSAALDVPLNYDDTPAAGGGRRLAEEHLEKVRRHLAEASSAGTLHNATRRKLISSSTSLGTLTLGMQQGYSNDGEWHTEDEGAPVVVIPFEPDTLSMPSFIDVSPTFPNPTLDDLSRNGGVITAVANLQGANGTHWLQMHAGIKRAGHSEEWCFSPPMSFDIINSISYVDVSCRRQATTGRERVYTFAEAQEIIIDLEFHFVPGTPIPGKPGSGLPELKLTKDRNRPGGVYVGFIEVPMIWQGAIAEGSDLDQPQFEITESEPYSLFTDTTTGDEMGKFAVKLKFKLPGLFGNFALMFGSAGTFSEPFPFEVSEPPNLQAEIIAEPSMVNWTVVNSGDMLPQAPIIRITSNGQPINGVKGFAELVPSEGAVFTKMTDWHLFDAFEMSQSWASGYKDKEGKELFDLSCWWTRGLDTFCRNDWTGVAIWPIAMLLDGSGKGKVRIWLGEKTAVPGLFPVNGSLNFRSAVKYAVLQNPPAKMPLGLALSKTRKSNPFTILMNYPYGLTDLAKWGIFSARLSVGKYNGRILSKAEALSKTNLLFENTGCFWAGGENFGNICGPLQILNGYPTPTASFEVRGITWKTIEEIPTTLALVPSDLSLSPLLEKEVLEMPAGMASWPQEKQNEHCLLAAEAALSGIHSTNTIAPEIAPASAKLVIPPPAVVEVGSTFLVRLLVLTSSGGPVAGRTILVSIVPTVGLNPDLADGDTLQRMANFGNTLKAMAAPDVRLDPTSTRAKLNPLAHGVASFPLSIEQAKGGNYVLKFEMEGSNSQVLHTSPPFTVANPLLDITSYEDWGSVEVKDFNNPVQIPKKLRFDVRVTGNRTLGDLVYAGYAVVVRLSLKGVSPEVRKQMEQMRKAAEAFAKTQAESVAKKSEDAAKVLSSAAVDAAANKLSKASATGPFSRMAPDLRTQCYKSTMGSLAKEMNMTSARAPELANAVSENPSILSAGERVTQFVRTFTGAGQKMALSSAMRIQLERTFGWEDLKLISYTEEENDVLRCTYEVVTPIDFKFVPNGEYAWKVAINGVASKDDTFKHFIATKIQPTPAESAFNWVVNSFVVILGITVLITNTNMHHWLWFALAIPCVIFVMCVVPTLKNSKDALLGAWPILAEIFLAFILITLIWGLVIELMRVFPQCASVAAKAKTKPFGDRRADFFEQYTIRRMMLFIGRKADADGRPLEPHPATLKFKDFCKQMIRPFNPGTAFYFPSQIWTGLALSMLSFTYILIQVIRIIEDLDSSLMALVDRAVSAVIQQITTIEASYEVVSGGAQLPDDATGFMVKQIELVRGWFQNLVSTFRVGFIIGVVVAALVTIGVQFMTFYVFRRYTLQMRNGICPWGKRADGAVVYDSMFVGQYVATTIIGFILIVLIVIVVVLPFHFHILWRMLWSWLPYLLTVFILPFLLTKIQLIIVKKIIFQPFAIKHRAAASIFMFWQLWVSILGGITGALVRGGIAIGGLLIALPTVVVPVTPQPLNAIMLLDTPYKTFLAAITMYHCHNHPIVLYAARCLSSFLAQRQNLRAMGEKNEEGIREAARKKAKRWVCLILMTHPSLAYWRKHNIAARRKQAKRDEEEKMAAMDREKTKLKPPKEEVAILEAILEKRLEEYRITRRIEALETQYAHIRQIPPGEERTKALQKLLDGMKSPRG